MCIKKVLNSLKHLVVTNKMITFANKNVGVADS